MEKKQHCNKVLLCGTSGSGNYASPCTVMTPGCSVITVLLAPYGLTGLLTGRAYSDSDPKTQKLLEDWRRYFYVPPPADSTTEDGSHIPLFVEVVVGMFCYIFGEFLLTFLL